MTPEWVIHIRRSKECREQSMKILKAITKPSARDAKELLSLLQAVDVKILISQATRIITSNKSCRPLAKSKYDFDNLDIISTRMETSPQEAQIALEKFQTLDSADRKRRPSMKISIVSEQDFYRLKAYLNECISLSESGTMPDRRKRWGLSVVKSFRLILTAIEISEEPDTTKIKSNFRKLALGTAGLQFHAVIKKKIVGSEDTAIDCGASCIKPRYKNDFV